MTAEPITPNELAAELGRSPKTVRDWLRKTYPRGDEHRQLWHLTPEQVDAARINFP